MNNYIISGGADYSPLNQFLVFNSGDSMMCVNITILNDFVVENPESFFVNLTNTTGEPLFNAQATVVIFDEG